MLVLPNDSGYNSPCDGIAPSSLQSASEKFLPDVNLEVRRKLRFETHTCWNSGSYFTLPKPNDRLREIARRFVQICDSFDKEFAEVAEETKMLVLPGDSGYNSPCDGISPSSLQSPSRKSQKTDSMEVCRKLRFDLSHTCWNSGSYSTPPQPDSSLREIARRLLQMCDSFDKEFTETSETTEDLTWSASIFRLIGF